MFSLSKGARVLGSHNSTYRLTGVHLFLAGPQTKAAGLVVQSVAPDSLAHQLRALRQVLDL